MSTTYDPQELLTIEDLLPILKVSERWLRGEITSGRLAATRLGPKTVRVSRAQLQQYLDSRRTA